MIQAVETTSPAATRPDGGLIAIIPAHNEARFIGSVVLITRAHVDTVIVVDDGSDDATASIARAAGALVIQHETNRGKGVALNTGFMKARELAPRAVITLDGDWQHMPEDIGRVAAPILRGEADIVIGSRYLDQTSEVPAQRAIGHWGFTSLTNLVSGVRVSDSQSGYRAFSPAALRALVFSSNSFSVESEMQFLARDHHLRLVEVPITIRYVDKPKRSLLAHGWTVLNGLLRLVAQHRPLLFFGVPGVILLLIGLVLGLQVVEIYNRFETLAVGTALMVVMLLLGGMFFVFTGLLLHTLRAQIAEIKEQIRR